MYLQLQNQSRTAAAPDSSWVYLPLPDCFDPAKAILVPSSPSVVMSATAPTRISWLWLRQQPARHGTRVATTCLLTHKALQFALRGAHPLQALCPKHLCNVLRLSTLPHPDALEGAFLGRPAPAGTLAARAVSRCEISRSGGTHDPGTVGAKAIILDFSNACRLAACPMSIAPLGHVVFVLQIASAPSFSCQWRCTRFAALLSLCSLPSSPAPCRWFA